MPEEGYSFGAIAKDHLFGMTTFDMRGDETTPSSFVKIELPRIELGQSFVWKRSNSKLERPTFCKHTRQVASEWPNGCQRIPV